MCFLELNRIQNDNNSTCSVFKNKTGLQSTIGRSSEPRRWTKQFYYLWVCRQNHVTLSRQWKSRISNDICDEKVTIWVEARKRSLCIPAHLVLCFLNGESAMRVARDRPYLYPFPFVLFSFLILPSLTLALSFPFHSFSLSISPSISLTSFNLIAKVTPIIFCSWEPVWLLCRWIWSRNALCSFFFLINPAVRKVQESQLSST